MVERRIKFRHLQCFFKVAQQQSVVRAADALAISQPAVSRTIRELEEALDAKLFDRSQRGVRLAPSGEVFLRYAGASVTALTQGIESIAQIRRGGRSVIRIGVLPTVAANLIPAAVKHFKERGLGTTINLVTGAHTVLIADLRIGDLDLMVGRLAEPEHMIGLTFEHLHSKRIAFVVRPEHPLLADVPFDIKRLRAFEMIYPDSNAITRPEVDRF